MANEAAAPARPSFGLTVLAVSLPMFMVALDNLVVTNALASIRSDLDATVQGLQWVTNSYILGFASLLLVAAGLGDRYGRRKVFVSGLTLFVLFSVGCALSTSTEALVTLRALQGMSAAAVLPLSLTMLTVAVPPEKRGVAIGVWSSISSLAVGIAPLIGGAITTGIGWHWLFWLNVPIGLIAVPLVLRVHAESKGAAVGLDPLGLLLGAAGVLALVWAIVDSSDYGWTSARVLGKYAAAAVLLVAFVLWERRTTAPLLPLRIYRSRAFTLTNLSSLAVYFGLFGSIFFLAQYLQVARHHSPFVAGLWTLPWAVMPTIFAPYAGKLIPKVGPARLIAAGLGLSAVGLAWCALISDPGTADWQMVVPYMLCGIGTGLIFAPSATVVVSSVQPQDIGKASGTNATVREIGSALGIAVLTTVFINRGGNYTSPEAFTDAVIPGLWICVAVLLLGGVVALGIPALKPPAAAPAPTKQPALD
ncbi:MFS transporter [Streptomyces sp. 5-8]|uniref:MFS transporter n=1 Tax=Streptomyces musisoli TaxID=2802280 RepID=A0ABS1NUK3_9ACTN|nr:MULTISPECIES: MFS transporter [Streptomyces]MBL1103789.1 MFS transporter [Streptomyces musisoli]MBY8843596.1 MFS transporter [Streptomyces sp. SP2-10]